MCGEGETEDVMKHLIKNIPQISLIFDKPSDFVEFFQGGCFCVGGGEGHETTIWRDVLLLFFVFLRMYETDTV
jgi:hypothetical protein